MNYRFAVICLVISQSSYWKSIFFINKSVLFCNVGPPTMAVFWVCIYEIPRFHQSWGCICSSLLTLPSSSSILNCQHFPYCLSSFLLASAEEIYVRGPEWHWVDFTEQLHYLPDMLSIEYTSMFMNSDQ